MSRSLPRVRLSEMREQVFSCARRRILITDTLNVNIISSGQRMEIDRVNRYGMAAVTADCRNFIRVATFPAINAGKRMNGRETKEGEVNRRSLACCTQGTPSEFDTIIISRFKIDER
jgi:hypothetical protein